jgi:putative glutathione S-transferase
MLIMRTASQLSGVRGNAPAATGAREGDYAPAELLPQIDAINAEIYDAVNNGVYKAGFATAQDVYEKEVANLFAYLDGLEIKLGRQPYLLGERITEADWRLFTTLIRFDAVYHGHFKCNLRRLVDYGNLWSYTRELYQWPGVASTVDFDHIKRHYYRSHHSINPNGIVPAGPILDLERASSRSVAARAAVT